jgi:hypothetical protein
MKKALSTLFVIFIGVIGFAQDDLNKMTKPIVDEGKRLYKSEMASWYGTDIFMENFSEKEKIGGYLSYSENDEVTKCIFFSKDEKPKVLGTITFDPSLTVQNAKKDLNERDLTFDELDLFAIRKEALKNIYVDTIFKIYKNTDYNIIPLISNGERKVYVLTGPKENGVVLFGNDYLMTFDKKNKLKSSKQLHKSLISLSYGKESISGAHTHVIETGDFITATDICTLMLYERFAKWESHYVMSKKYVSIWDCRMDSLTVMTQEAFEKIATAK